uniref:Alpha-2-macroglobulin-like n=1 Tax=Sinocyclocheilus rhinocerous TaxID=307959 RepID=A0A673I5N0_9TELE
QQTPLVEAESVQTMKVELQGKNFKMTEERKVMLRRYNHLTFIQTDKPIYIPGQTAKLYRHCVFFGIKQDNQNNRIGQWKNISSTNWILQLSHVLNPEARQGIYKLMAYIGERAITHYFEVKKYVLPKFEITMKAPKEITFGDSDMNMEVCGKYTFGKPVTGKARVEVCREHLRYISQTDLISPCLVETTESLYWMFLMDVFVLYLQMSAVGCASFTLDTLAFFNSTNERFLKEHLTVKVNVTEEGTGDRSMQNLHIEKIHLSPLQNKDVYLLEGKRWSSKLLLNLTTDSDGLCLINFCHRSVICLFQVMSRGVIVHHGYEKVEVKSSNGAASGTVSFKLSVGADLAPAILLSLNLILTPQNGSIFIIGTLKWHILLLSSQVSLQFSPAKAVPGEKNTLQLSAQPGSLCGLSAVDKSVLILKPGKNLDTDKSTVFLHTCISHLFEFSGRKFSENRGSAQPPVETVRTLFPETWIWQLTEVGDSGSAQVPVTVPDTITSWDTEAFCLSSKGLGLAPPAQLTVFQPFFLELSLPYSIIRGEIFELKATVFNYLSKCIMVKVTPAPSSDYTLKASSDDQYSSCLCANGRKTFKWILTPSVLGVLNITVSAEAEASQTVCDNEIVSVPERGRIDTVTRSLLVQAEGTEKTETYSWLLCPKGNSLSEEVNLTLPKDVIEGSARSTVSVIGDILGRALSNLHGLLRMPYGCGEQNMAVLSPNIYILQYLENTEQLTSAIRERATGFLKSGYQRQLNYRHNSGAYSTFGHGKENTWLTAFVLRSFGKAQKYIFIDPQIIQSVKKWLISRRDSDGCFIQQGRLFNNRMKGGVNDNVTMTAYITASLLELETPVTDPVVTKGLSCLRSVIKDVKNTYTTALLAYTFSLAKDMDTRQQLFKKLEETAISDGSHLHWSQSGSADSDSLAVEISSYVLLAVLTADSLTTADLGFANRIVSWLVKQQNGYGGFSSTQDTVVALQALSLYATKVFSSDGSSTVTVQSAADTHHFDVNQDNKLLYQEKQLQNVPAKYSVEVKGSACVSVQVCSAFSFIDSHSISSLFPLLACCGYFAMRWFINVYDGRQERTNMVIVDIKLLSGFTADTSMVHLSVSSQTSLQTSLRAPSGLPAQGL